MTISFENNRNFLITKKRLIAISSLILILIFERLILLKLGAFPFNSDEAIVGLMAKHILQGERPIFFYGQAYMGSLDAFLVSFAFKIFGIHVWVIRFVQIFLFALTLIALYMFVIIAFDDDKIAFLSSSLLVFSPINLVLYTTVSLGGYGEAFLIGAISFLISVLLIKQFLKFPVIDLRTHLNFIILGFLCGLGLWTNAISLVFTLPAIFFVVIQIVKLNFSKKEFFRVAMIFQISFIFGSLLWWFAYFSGANGQTFSELSGGAVAVESGNFFSRTLSHFISFVLFAPTVITGLRPPWSTLPINIWFTPFVIAFWVLVLFAIFKIYKQLRLIEKISVKLLLSCSAILIAAFVFSSFGVDPSGRYFLPLTIALSIFGGIAIEKFQNKIIIYGLFVTTIVFYVVAMSSLAINKPGITTQFYGPAQVDNERLIELKEFLIDHGETRGYTNYWVAYPLIFISDESIISVPALPYHPDLSYTSRDDRYPPYLQDVTTSEKVFYVTTNNPPLDYWLADAFKKNGIGYKYFEIGDYHIYYDLSERVTPEKLGLYEFNQ